MKKYFFILVILASSFLSYLSLFAQELEAFWTLVFAGDNITTPVYSAGNIYTAGADKALNCITSKGSFLWRRNTGAYPTSLISTSSDGVVYLVTKGGNIEAYSSQGVSIWTYKCKKMPLFPVYVSDEGYILLTFSDKLICLTRQGKLKWELALPSNPAKQPVEVAEKNIVLLLQDGILLRFSMFGKVIEKISVDKRVETVSFAPQGFVVSSSDSSLAYYKLGEPSTLLWQTNEVSVCRMITYRDRAFFCAYANGDAVLKKVEDGTEVWKTKLDKSLSENVQCNYRAGEFNIRDKGFAAIVTQKGRVKWQKSLVEKQFLPIITDNGLLIGIRSEILNAYRMETRLVRKKDATGRKRLGTDVVAPNDVQKREEENKDMLIHRATILYLLGFSTFDFFKGVEEDIHMGAVGEKEDYYAIMLTGILENGSRFSYFPHEFSSFERGRAASLLGQMGLYEYRDVLLEQITVGMDGELAIGILRGLTALAYDPDGKTINGIMFILNRTSPSNVEVLKAVADAFLSLAKFGDEITAKKAVESIFSIMNGAYPAVTKGYVRQKLKNIA